MKRIKMMEKHKWQVICLGT